MLPLEGVRVAEFAHTVMRPSCGLVLADLGAGSIKVEPLNACQTGRWTAGAPPGAPTRRAWASTRGNCSPVWAVHRRKSKACATAV